MQANGGNDGSNFLFCSILADDADVFAHGPPGQQPRALKHITHLDIGATDAARIWTNKSGDDVEQGAFAAARGPDEGKDLAFGKGKRKIIEHRQPAVAFRDVF